MCGTRVRQSVQLMSIGLPNMTASGECAHGYIHTQMLARRCMFALPIHHKWGGFFFFKFFFSKNSQDLRWCILWRVAGVTGLPVVSKCSPGHSLRAK